MPLPLHLGKAGLSAPRLANRKAAYRSAEGRAKRLIPLPLSLHLFFFCVFGPEIACQVLKLTNPLNVINLPLAF